MILRGTCLSQTREQNSKCYGTIASWDRNEPHATILAQKLSGIVGNEKNPSSMNLQKTKKVLDVIS
ncbi:hypothetical protein JHK87_014134 [Glycine soja]|nr:hypothetical protein JHK87_014134 [Glycine soja]